MYISLQVLDTICLVYAYVQRRLCFSAMLTSVYERHPEYAVAPARRHSGTNERVEISTVVASNLNFMSYTHYMGIRKDVPEIILPSSTCRLFLLPLTVFTSSV
jgi:hypothetical protein